MTKPENLISIDLETWGPDPRYGIAAIGAASLLDGATFYGEATADPCPFSDAGDCQTGLKHWRATDAHELFWHVDPESQAIHQLNPDDLGMPEHQLVQDFNTWVRLQPRRRIFASWSSFDWAFMYPALARHCATSPFSHSSLEMKSLYMGAFGTTWGDTVKGEIARVRPDLLAGLPPHTHNALDDAKEQAELLRRIINHSRRYAHAEGV